MKYKLTLSDQELAVVSDGLMHVPFGRAAPVVAEINRQIHQQRVEDQSQMDVNFETDALKDLKA